MTETAYELLSDDTSLVHNRNVAETAAEQLQQFVLQPDSTTDIAECATRSVGTRTTAASELVIWAARRSLPVWCIPGKSSSPRTGPS